MNRLSIVTAPSSGSGLEFKNCLQLIVRNEGAGSTALKINSNSARITVEPQEHIEIFADPSGRGLDVKVEFYHDLPNAHNVQIISLEKHC